MSDDDAVTRRSVEVVDPPPDTATPDADGRAAGLVVGAVVGAVLAVVLVGELGRSFDYDESVSVSSVISAGSPTRPLTTTAVFNNHPFFAVGQSIWWRLGGAGEARQRVLPIAYAALAGGLLSGWLAARWGRLSGLAAGVVMVANPMFVSQARLVRGYSLAVLGVVLAIVAAFEYLARRGGGDGGGGDGARRRWSSASAWLGLHGAAAAIAVGTHAYAALPLLGLGVGLIVAGAVDRRLLLTWCVSAGVASLAYVFTFDELRANAEARGSQFRPWFPRVVSWEVLGTDRLTAVLLGALAAVGVAAAVVAGRRRDRRAAAQSGSRSGSRAAAPLVALGAVAAVAWAVWQLWAPFDLYPRFFVGLVPLVALAVARAVRMSRWLFLAVAVAAAATFGNVLEVRRSIVPLRETAAVVDEALALGLRPCVVGGESLLAYTSGMSEFDPVRPSDSFARCDLVIAIGGWARSVYPDADAEYGGRGTVAGTFLAWSRVPELLDGVGD